MKPIKSKIKKTLEKYLQLKDWIRAKKSRLVLHDLGLVDTYQPFAGKDDVAARECVGRWNAVEPHLRQLKGAFLDIGSNAGYFSFKISGEGNVCFGIESDRVYWELAEAGKMTVHDERTFFLQWKLTPENVTLLPYFDGIICLSVFHHWVKWHGFEKAKIMMSNIAEKCVRCLVFETGQNNETDTSWAGLLGFMGSDPKSWVESFLRDLGFRDIKCVGSFATTLSPVPRHLFVAFK